MKKKKDQSEKTELKRFSFSSQLLWEDKILNTSNEF